MDESTDVREGMLRFYRGVSDSDIESFEDIVSKEAVLVIGTAPGEWVTERERMRFGFEAEGLRIEPGPAPIGYAEGSLGWLADEPTFVFPDGSPMKTRLTSVLRHEEGKWRLVHVHVSVGVPDDEVVELQRRWAASG
jgi:hypothetical protein